MFGSRKLIPLLVIVGMGAFGATAASAHGHTHGGHGHGHGGHGHGHGQWGNGHGHGHWGHASVYYGGHCHIRHGYNPYGEFVVRRVCY
ncbi:MAG: hypothetical protein K2Y56_06730 [Methylobacterium sp.]|uniref:hypothetical protein n=1 Tax=Methylobacterium sp. TaxID=409 RepID=UPI0025F72E1C|nr:hypothetical protein [Methylobacterium sp.]MBX9931218.1 hypothetical protein [Methylobacterium sp.]